MQSDVIADAYARACARPTDINALLPTLRDEAIAVDAQVLVELGVGSGNSTSALLAATLETGGRLWSVDVVIPEGFLFDYTAVPEWTYLIADDLAVVGECPRPIDCLFIDSAHNYEQTFAELEAYVPLMRPGGVLMMHDTVSWPSVTEAIKDYTADHPMTRERWVPESNGLYVGHS